MNAVTRFSALARGAVTVILGLSTSMLIMGLMLFSIPLSVLSIMRLFGYEWWFALIAVVGLNIVPAIGQIATLVLTIMGAYYFISAGGNWREAVYPTPQTFSFTDMPANTFSKLKTTSSFPKQFTADRTTFTQSIKVLGQSSDLTQPSNNSGEAFTIPKATEQQIYSKNEEGIALSKKVGDAFLDYIHPDLKNYYRNKLIAGAEIWYEGITANNNGDVSLGVQKQIEGINLMIEWNNWWKSHNEDAADKAFPKE
jgi:hypothetical protein